MDHRFAIKINIKGLELLDSSDVYSSDLHTKYKLEKRGGKLYRHFVNKNFFFLMHCMYVRYFLDKDLRTHTPPPPPLGTLYNRFRALRCG